MIVARLSDRPHWWVLGLLLAGTLHLWIVSHWWYASVGVYDAGIVVHGAERVFAGQVPYRDFFTFFGPLAFWLPAAVYALFGVSTGTIVGLIVVVGTLHALATWLMARAVGLSALAALVPWSITLGMAYPLWPVPSHHWYATLLLDAAVLACLWWQRSRGLWRLSLAGACAGAGVAVFQVVGAAGLLAILLWAARAAGRAGALAVAAGAGGVALATLGTLLAQGALAHAWQDAVVFPLFAYGGKNVASYLLTDALHVASDVDLLRTAAHWLVLQALGWLAPPLYLAVTVWLWRRRTSTRLDHAILLLYLAGGLTLLASIYSLTLVHFAYVAGPATVLATWALARLAGRFFPRCRAPLVAAAALVCLLLVAPLPQVAALAAGRVHAVATPRGPVWLGTDPGVLPYDLPGIVEHVQYATETGQAIYVYPALGILYTLLGRPNATSYDYLFPGENPSAQFERLRASLEREAVPLVVYDPRSTEWVAQYTADGRVEGERMDAYFARHYRAAGQYDHWQVLERLPR